MSKYRNNKDIHQLPSWDVNDNYDDNDYDENDYENEDDNDNDNGSFDVQSYEDIDDDDFIAKLKENCKIKSINNKRFNAQMLLGLSMDFCEAVNNNETPKIENSVTRLVFEEI